MPEAGAGLEAEEPPEFKWASPGPPPELADFAVFRQDELREVLELGAVDGEFFCHQWFPRTFRQSSPPQHKVVWDNLEGGYRFVSVEMARGWAKTTLLRAFTAKRISYAESRTILLVGESQDAAKRSVRWLRRQVLHNRAWADFFQLSLGSKKTDEWLEIYHGVEQIPISVIAVGITGQTRGINLDDFRPDLIIVDDPCDEENTNTAEQRKKISKLFFGALAKSLAPPVDCENALMCLLQTPLHPLDLISQCRSDPQFRSFTFSCFDADGESTWPERYPTLMLLEDKAAHIARNDLPLWLREMECKVVAEGSASFRSDWLKPYPADTTPKDLLAEGGQAYLWIDPVPPPSPRQIEMGLQDKDYEAMAVVIKYRGEIYLAETTAERGHNPDWTLMEFWRLVDTYRVTMFGVETVAYQRTLKWLLEQSMRQKSRYLQCHVDDKQDKRKKTYRIVDNLKGIASQGAFYVDFKRHGTFVDQFTTYPATDYDDVIEAVAEATRIALESSIIEGIYSELYEEDSRPQLGHAP